MLSDEALRDGKSIVYGRERVTLSDRFATRWKWGLSAGAFAMGNAV